MCATNELNVSTNENKIFLHITIYDTVKCNNGFFDFQIFTFLQ